jgi:hypothetical protein
MTPSFVNFLPRSVLNSESCGTQPSHKRGALADPRKQPRFVKADQGGFLSDAWDQAVQHRSAFDTKPVIWIETTASSGSTPADIVMLAVLDYFETLIGRFEEGEG